MNINVIKKTVRNNERQSTRKASGGDYVEFNGEEFFRIHDSHLMPEFFMSITSSSDHWMFISSRGALTAGRKDPENALFPYYSADKISDMAAVTGSRTLIRVGEEDNAILWRPFDPLNRPERDIQRNLYKNKIGNRVVFEEVHHSLDIAFRYQWTFGEPFGFIRTSWLVNLGEEREIEILDGLQNILPSGVDQGFQLRFSNLGNAYKKSELIADTQLGIYYLSSIPTDRAEPSEGLRASVVWQTGMDSPNVLLSDQQVSQFLDGDGVTTEEDVRGKPGCYFVSKKMVLKDRETESWTIVAEINQDQTDVANLQARLKANGTLPAQIEEAVSRCQQRLEKIISLSDGYQSGQHSIRANRHQSNVLFNLMRGGYPAFGYSIPADDLVEYVQRLDRRVFERNQEWLEALDGMVDKQTIVSHARESGDLDLLRMLIEYLPLTFGRRHGDPTRPWNHFSISTLNEDGSPSLDYQGNWRDIFQNWEALAFSFPNLTEGFVLRFVNSSTADGYNPYRVTKYGFEWETPDPNDPWANIGYWGDHQVIYLLKLLEWSNRYSPGSLNQWLNEDVCSYAEVPYVIKSYEDILQDPQKTIDFNFLLDDHISRRVSEVGEQGKLLCLEDGSICKVNLVEKLLVLTLAKMSNFVPDGGIWLNTQRPEWNDANNALVGRGLSVVTVCYLRRFFAFMEEWFQEVDETEFRLSGEVASWLEGVFGCLTQHQSDLPSRLDKSQRKSMVDCLSSAACNYRKTLYSGEFGKQRTIVSREQLLNYFQISRQFLDSTIDSNRRTDGLFHSYNLLDFEADGMGVSHLDEMLEGQVAVLSSGRLSPDEAMLVLDSLRSSRMYRQDQNSYMLYPDRQLKRFTEKNCIPESTVEASPLLKALLEADCRDVIKKDCQGACHFNGNLKNSDDLKDALQNLQVDDTLKALIDQHESELLSTFEDIFDHSSFTGRSGTFFAYEGLGSIYWHMVSKLLLAATENYFWALDDQASESVVERLRSHCAEIRDGIAVEKSPQQYGAFPTDPYSHTPQGAGVKQPGMTGQVKEDILARFMELGVHVVDGKVVFRTELFDSRELHEDDSELRFVSLNDSVETIELSKQSFGFTVCQVPVLYRKAANRSLRIHFKDGKQEQRDQLELTPGESQMLFSRTGEISSIEVSFS